MIRLAVGLQNPGLKYQSTRHNLGQLVVRRLARDRNVNFSHVSGGAIVAPISLELSGQKLLLCLLSDPDSKKTSDPTFMNESGPKLAEIVRYYDDIKPAETLVVSDDFSIPFGTVRIRRSGSSGGHNGLQSIIDTLGTEEFPRLRLGIGPVPDRMDPADFVLQRFTPQEEVRLEDFITRGANALVATARDLDRAMNEYNQNLIK